MKGKGLLLALIMTAGTLLAQPAPADQPTPAPTPAAGLFAPEPQRVGVPNRVSPRGGGFGPGDGMGMPGPGGMKMRRGGDGMPGGRWWKDSRIAQDIGLSDQQATQIEKIFQDHRLQLVDLHANLEKAEIAMEPMMQADQPNEAQITSQIDKIAQARAALEKSNALMLLGIRRVLTADQWKKLQAQERQPRPFGGGFRGPGGPDGGMRLGPRARRASPASPAPPAQPAPAPQPPQE